MNQECSMHGNLCDEACEIAQEYQTCKDRVN